MSLVLRAAQKFNVEIKLLKAKRIYKRYRTFTMIPPYSFACNLVLCEEKAPETGCIVEAGVWRGGMSAGIADMVPGRTHYLFDSFEGLPPAKEIDGEAALNWQKNITDASYYDNCRAERYFAEQAMANASAKKVHLVQGWFNETIPGFVPSEPIDGCARALHDYLSAQKCADRIQQWHGGVYYLIKRSSAEI